MFDLLLGNAMVITGACLGCLLLVLGLLLAYRHLTKKVGPNEALIIFGGKGTRIIVGGSGFVNPVTERHKVFSLELMSFILEPEHMLYTTQGIGVHIQAVAQIRVRTDELSWIRIAAEQFLDKATQEKDRLICQLAEGHLRHIVGHLTVEDLVRNTDFVAEKMVASARQELERLGLEFVSFSLKQVQDTHGYIENLGRLKVAEIEKQAAIALAQAERDIAIARANASRAVDEERSPLEERRRHEPVV